MREVGKIAGKVVAETGRFLKAGMTCDQVDEFVHNLIISFSPPCSLLSFSILEKICVSCEIDRGLCSGFEDDSFRSNIP
jgi:methionine aminopeptidase